MENLGNDVLENILFRLPFGVAFQAKRVCKSWKTILTERIHNEVGFLFACRDDNKIQLYFGEEYDHMDVDMMNYYYSHETLMVMEHCRFVYKPYHRDIMVGSCNGLVCFEKEDPGLVTEPFAICNPLTGEFIFLKANFIRVWDYPAVVTNGFGYCHSTNKYKVVRIYSRLDGTDYGSHVQVYTIGSNKWRYLRFITYLFCESGIFANGVLHWLDDSLDGSWIVTFDLEDENFRELPLPPPEAYDHEHGNSHANNELKLLGGNLCWVKSSCSRIDIWAYKKKNRYSDKNKNPNMNSDKKGDYYCDELWYWVKEYVIESGHQPFAITKTNKVLMLDTKNFHCYDPKTNTISKLGDVSTVMGSSRVQVIPHANSYVSLKHFGETWYGPGCSAVPQTNSSVLLTEVMGAYANHKRKWQS